MKKSIFSFIACVALMQSSDVAASALNDSLLIEEAIPQALILDRNFQNVIGQNETIVDIKRLTMATHGTLMFEIVTVVDNPCDMKKKFANATTDEVRPGAERIYDATLFVERNTNVGHVAVSVTDVQRR